METRRTIEPGGSPVPGVIPEPLRVHYDSVPAHEGRLPTPPPSAATERASSPRRRNAVTVLLAKLLSALRRDKQPADAHPPTRARPVTDAAIAATPDSAGQPATAGSQTKER
jgi:hypothetical protein